MEHLSDKRLLREQLQQRRRELDPELRVQQSAELCAIASVYIHRLREQKRNQPFTVFSYLAYRDEPDTLPLLEQCWKHGDRVLAPRIQREQQGIFELYEISGIDDVEPGMYGIPEPQAHTAHYPTERWHEIDLVIVPGLGYDRSGGRIGYGGGYYDRFMAQLTVADRNHRPSHKSSPLLAAPAFHQQLVRHIPMEPHDFRIHLLFTPSGVIHTHE